MERSPKPDSPTPLTYATPRILFQGQYQTRNRHQLYGGIFCLTFAAGIGLAAFHWRGEIRSVIGSMTRNDGVIQVVIAVTGCSLLPLLLLAAGVYALWAYWQDRTWDVLITEDGITRGGRFWKWEEIAIFGATHVAGGVTIDFCLSATNPFSQRALDLHPRLSAEQYRDIARTLMLHVVPRHRHLKVISEPQHSG